MMNLCNRQLLLALTLCAHSLANAEPADFCRSACFSEKNICRKDADHDSNRVGGAPAAVAASLAVMALQHDETRRLNTSPEWRASDGANKRNQQSAIRAEVYRNCDEKFTQCVMACRQP